MLVWCWAAFSSTADYYVVPMPRTVNLTGKEAFVLDEKCRIVFAKDDEEMERNALFLQDYIRRGAGMELTLSGGNDRSSAGCIRLLIDGKISCDEGYEIVVNSKGITVSGKTSAGVFYGIQTLRKALPAGAAGAVEFPAAVIADAPRFAYRGMMLDCARHFFPIEFVKQYIDLLAMHNMNRFHWHLSDDQGWRIEIKKYPRLVDVGSVRKQTTIGHNCQIYDGMPYGGYYTQDEAREVVEYARQRHIVVVPEIDMPGHQQSALASYPELGCTGGPYEVGMNWGIYLNILCLGNEQTYAFCEDVLSEIMDIFPSELIHIGGDEAPKDVVANCEKCHSLMDREGLNTGNVQGYFTNRIEEFVNSKGRRIIGWDEILDGDINQSAVVQCWRSADKEIQAVKAGHDVIVSPTSNCYLDYYQASPADYNEPAGIGGYLPIEKVYELNAVPDGLTEEDASHVLGVQGNLWTEYIAVPNHVLYMVLPRMAALCEEQWCAEKGTFDAFLPRLTRLTGLYRLYNLPYARHLWPETIGAKDRDYM